MKDDKKSKPKKDPKASKKKYEKPVLIVKSIDNDLTKFPVFANYTYTGS